MQDYLRSFSGIKVITELVGKPLECQTIHHVECPCIFGFLYESKRELYFNIMERWQQVASKVANMEEFNTEVFFNSIIISCQRILNLFLFRILLLTISHS